MDSRIITCIPIRESRHSPPPTAQGTRHPPHPLRHTVLSGPAPKNRRACVLIQALHLYPSCISLMAFYFSFCRFWHIWFCRLGHFNLWGEYMGSRAVDIGTSCKRLRLKGVGIAGYLAVISGLYSGECAKNDKILEDW